jgi:succinyl-diaminopimelate desuccinylase
MAQALIRCVSVTPADGGAQSMLASRLRALGFAVTPLPFGATLNFFARIGSGSPHICFAGHTDVVPPGEGWRHHPFGGVIENDTLYGRGACDMKGAIAAFVAAATQNIEENPSPAHSISLLITGDEEGPATDGTVRVLEWMAEHGHLPDLCIVGEPTNPRFLGEMVKIGRRGSLNASVTVRGRQGHVAYPMRASNPLHRLIPALAELVACRLDEGTAWFEPSSLQLTTVDVGNPAANVIPAAARARLNIRFSDLHTGESLSSWLRECVIRHAPDADIAIQVSGEAFLTQPGPLVERVCAVIERQTGHAPRRDTTGGTSDARFIARHAPVMEFGLVGASMHQVDECVPVADLRALAGIYAAILKDLCG